MSTASPSGAYCAIDFGTSNSAVAVPVAGGSTALVPLEPEQGERGRTMPTAVFYLAEGPGLQNLLFAQWQKDGARIVVWPKEAATGKMIPPPWMN